MIEKVIVNIVNKLPRIVDRIIEPIVLEVYKDIMLRSLSIYTTSPANKTENNEYTIGKKYNFDFNLI